MGPFTGTEAILANVVRCQCVAPWASWLWPERGGATAPRRPRPQRRSVVRVPLLRSWHCLGLRVASLDPAHHPVMWPALEHLSRGPRRGVPGDPPTLCSVWLLKPDPSHKDRTKEQPKGAWYFNTSTEPNFYTTTTLSGVSYKCAKYISVEFAKTPSGAQWAPGGRYKCALALSFRPV